MDRIFCFILYVQTAKRKNNDLDFSVSKKFHFMFYHVVYFIMLIFMGMPS